MRIQVELIRKKVSVPNDLMVPVWPTLPKCSEAR